MGALMLVYHPAFDFHHCVFRMVRLLNKLPAARYNLERIRVLDFYLLFPSQIPSMRFPTKLRGQRKRFEDLANKYDQLVDPYQVFLRLEPFQTEALGSLAAYALISAEALNEGFVERTATQIPPRLKTIAEAADEKQPDVIRLLAGPLSEIPMYGRDGLKGRTHLFECRYDPA
ncbi:MAG: hypothetical protein NT105_14010 [Verrucomicrobia bacterium]|nr:hypothetical protein [Verrucomicrobiota bacterium]